MAPHANVYHPDTCGCVVEFWFDDEMPVAERLHHVISHKPCAYHPQHSEGTSWKPGLIPEDQLTSHPLPFLADNHRRQHVIMVTTEYLGSDDFLHVAYEEDEKGRALRVHLQGAAPEHLAALKQHLVSRGHAAVEVLHG